LRIIMLGTSASIPTPKRGLPAIAVQRKDELILFDFGEGSQRNLLATHLGIDRKTKIFTTHLHGDHVLGIPGLIQTMSLLGRKKSLDIYGPEGIRDFVESILRTVRYTLTFPINVSEVGVGIVCKDPEYEVHAVWGEHGVPNLAYALIEKARPGKFNPKKAQALKIPVSLWRKLQYGENIRLPDGRSVRSDEVVGPMRPGRKIVYSGDTRPVKAIVKLAENADLLIHDATFAQALAEKAVQDGHSTASEAAEVAKKSKVKQLVLTHISPRYENPRILLKEAQKVFRKTKVAEDLMKFEISYLK